MQPHPINVVSHSALQSAVKKPQKQTQNTSTHAGIVSVINEYKSALKITQPTKPDIIQVHNWCLTR